jgi:hypothetical protein
MLPVPMVGGAAFLILADVAARTVQSPGEVPVGVVTALLGARFCPFVMRSRRARGSTPVSGHRRSGSSAPNPRRTGWSAGSGSSG